MSDEGLAVRPLADLHESEDNPREISDERYDALKYALKRDPNMLRARPLIATPDGEVVCGNMRLRALKELGWTEAPVYVEKFTSEAQKREWMLRDNQEYGDWVPEELAALLAQHRSDEADMKLLGFGEPQIESLLRMNDETQGAKDGSDDGTGATAEVWGVVVDCESEEEQAELVEELAGRGYECRALIPS